jgi:group I intron endonuclease
MDNCGVYSISFYTGSGYRVYIGSSINLANRHERHLKDLKSGKHSNQYLQRLWNKYHTLDIELFEECEIDNVREREQFWLDIFMGSEALININPLATGGSIKGVVHSKEHISKIAKALTGKHLSEEHKMAMSKATKGVPRCSKTPQWRLHLSQSHKGKKGMPLSEEHKHKISATLKKHIFSLEHKAHISEGQTRRWKKEHENNVDKR